MYVFDQSGVVDSAKLIEYITKEFPGEFKRLIEARDELAKRQGALSAVKDAAADREAAAGELAAAKAQAKELLDDAKAANAESAAKAKDLTAREKALAAKEADFAAEVRAKESDFEAAQQALYLRETALNQTAAVQVEQAARMDAAELALNARIKAFQDKVAALSV
jgi:DNA repair exonuclease SbcCD ATPase subunit